jgi:hypothetical protein
MNNIAVSEKTETAIPPSAVGATLPPIRGCTVEINFFNECETLTLSVSDDGTQYPTLRKEGVDKTSAYDVITEGAERTEDGVLAITVDLWRSRGADGAPRALAQAVSMICTLAPDDNDDTLDQAWEWLCGVLHMLDLLRAVYAAPTDEALRMDVLNLLAKHSNLDASSFVYDAERLRRKHALTEPVFDHH